MKFIIDFYNTATTEQINAYLTENNCTVIKEWDNFDKVFLVEAAAEPPVTDITLFVKNDENLTIRPVDIHTVDNTYLTTTPYTDGPNITIVSADQKDWWKNYSLRQPNFDAATTTLAKKGQRVNVYIMDSGIDATLPEFEGVNISNVYSIIPNDFSDNRGHGTALASVIAGNTCGITGSTLKIVKIFEPNYNTMQSQFLDALDAILNDVPENHFAVINCSWTIDKNEWIEYKFRQMIRRGIWVIAAAGNAGTTIENLTPACMPEVFTVGAYNQDLHPCDFSNYTGFISTTQNSVNEGQLDGWAPGENIYVAKTTAHGGGYDFVSGTSLSTAILSAVVAYNINDLLLPDGTIPEAYRTLAAVGPDAYTALLVNRDNLLDLSDPKYAQSVNKIATIIDMTGFPIALPPDYSVVAIEAGQPGRAKVFDNYITKTFELTTVLPNNWYLMPDGVIQIYTDISQGPQSNESYVLYKIEGKRTDLQDNVENVTVDVYVLAPNYEPSSLPEDHPINIYLQFGLCYDNYKSACTVTYSNPGGCGTGYPCGFLQYCCDFYGKNQYCYCAG